MTKASVILSFRNEEGGIDELIKRLKAALEKAAVDDFEIIFVNDDSTDRSLEILKTHAARDKRVKILTTSRRFGVYPCLMAGMKASSGDAVIYIDADLQDPPELIPEMLQKWQEGADVVYTTRTEREGESWMKMQITALAYKVINKVCEVPIPVNSGDFKLLSRRVVDHLNALGEPDPYFRGLVSWVGFRQVPVFYKREPRFAGEGKRSLFTRAPIQVFASAIVSFSTLPLHLALLGGIGFLALTVGVALLFLAFGNLLDQRALLMSLICLGCLSVGLLLSAIGIQGLYIARMYQIAKKRPPILFKEKIGL